MRVRPSTAGVKAAARSPDTLWYSQRWMGVVPEGAPVAVGTLLADNLQSLVGALERLLGTQFLDARVYYMSDLPAYVEGIDVLRVCGVAFVLCALATVYPAWRAARTAPAQALRHE